MTKRTKPAAVFDNVDMFAASCKPFKPATKKLPGVSGNYAALPTTKKPRRVKAAARTWEFRNAYGHYCGEEPIWSLPRTRADYDAMLRQVERALPLPWVIRRECAKLALRAIGITRPIMRGDMTGNMGGRT